MPAVSNAVMPAASPPNRSHRASGLSSRQKEQRPPTREEQYYSASNSTDYPMYGN